MSISRETLLEPVFQTGWFVESLMTQTLIIHVIPAINRRELSVLDPAGLEVEVASIL